MRLSLFLVEIWWKELFFTFNLRWTNPARAEFHKLKERRQFHELRSKAMGIAERNIAEMNPLCIGDDLYVVSLSEDENERVISALQNLGFDVEIFEWRLDKTADGLYLIRELPQPLAYSTGSGEKLEARVESQAEWARARALIYLLSSCVK